MPKFRTLMVNLVTRSINLHVSWNAIKSSCWYPRAAARLLATGWTLGSQRRILDSSGSKN